MIFAKNSDRDPNEAHQVVLHPAMEYPSGEVVNCTFISIPQVRRTQKVLLSKPFWIWGAEMGVNESGVVIGNEAIFSIVPPRKKPALTGMDLLRLGLERGTSARETVDVITKLLEEYGQGGNGGFDHPFYYHNTFLIADAGEAWILETVDREWVAKRVVGSASISNALTIKSQWDISSLDVGKMTHRKNGYHRGSKFDFANGYTDSLITYFSHAKPRQDCTTQFLLNKAGKISPQTMIHILRHHDTENENWSPDKALLGTDVCMHYGFGPVRINQTTGSLVVEVGQDSIQGWYTGTAAPCISLFKPFWFEAGLPSQGKQPNGICDLGTLFWEHETLHRSVIQDYPTRIRIFREERDQLEVAFHQGAEQRNSASREERLNYSADCLEISRQATRKWADEVERHPIQQRMAFYYSQSWNNINKKAALQKR